MGGLFLALLAIGCDRRSEADGERTRPVFCYRQAQRVSPGVWRLTDPLDCGSNQERYRAQGRRDRPEAIDLLDPDGQPRLAVKIEYDPLGRPVAEERTFVQRPPNVQLYQQGQKLDFRPAAGQEWERVRILTRLDEQARPMRIEKYTGDRLAFRVEREYELADLAREVTRDEAGQVRIERVFESKNGKRIETMKDGQGRMLFEREAQPGQVGEGQEYLDSQQPPQVQPRP